jgi:flagella basal body P-ring formation protein FlgA
MIVSFLSLLAAVLSIVPAGGRAAVLRPAATGEAVVIVAAEIVARKERLTLGDIAEIVSGDAEAKARLGAVELGYAPDVGAVRELPLEKIALAITVAGFSPHAVTVEGPRVAIVRRATQVIDPVYIREAVERAVTSDQRAKGAAVRLVRLDLPPVIEVAAGATEVRASIGGSRDLFAPFIASIEIRAGDRIIRRLSANAQAEAFAPVLVAVRDLPAGARVRPDDVIVETRRLTRAVSTYLRDASALRGIAMRRAVAQGEPLLADSVFAEIAIKVGDQVRIIGQSRTVLVEVKGEARSAGRVGDRIQVKNSQSGVMLQATVEDEGVVRVHF